MAEKAPRKKHASGTKFDPVLCDECGEPRWPFGLHINRPKTYTCQRCRAKAKGRA